MSSRLHLTCPAEIIGKRRQCTTMHMAAVVEMTVINIEFADELVLVSVGNAGCRNMLAFQNGRGVEVIDGHEFEQK